MKFSSSVPKVDINLRLNRNVDVYWKNSLPTANYTATGCCKHNGHKDSGLRCPECLQVKKICKDDTESGKKACESFVHFCAPDATIVVNLTIHVPGCPDQSNITCLKTTFNGN